MANWKKLAQGAAGAAGGAGLNVEDVFSTYLYEGASVNPPDIVNNIDLANEGGMVWVKSRFNSFSHGLFDTVRGVKKYISSNNTDSEQTWYPNYAFDSFTSTGVEAATNGNSIANFDGSYASWTFRKAPKFFDVVTYTGTGSAQNISHNLGSVPGVIITKRLDSTSDWGVYHRGYGSGGPAGILNGTDAAFNLSTYWNNTDPTSTQFTLGSFANVNASGGSYVAYLFAHNDGDGDFGPTGDQDIIKCGSYTTDVNEDATIDLGWEPQWVLVKRTDSTGGSDWRILDNMRGWEADGDAAYVEPNTSDAEAQTGDGRYYLTSTGFKQDNFGANRDYIYIAIRRGPMAVPESASDVFDIATRDGTTYNGPDPDFSANHLVDFVLYKDNITTTGNWVASSRLQQGQRLIPNTTSTEASSSFYSFDYMSGWGNSGNSADTNDYSWMWKRAPNYFDVVAYSGNGATNHTVSHNLGVAPEMILIKNRGDSTNWPVYHSGLTSAKMLRLNSTTAEFNMGTIWGNQTFDASGFTVGSTSDETNKVNNNYIAYLFASLDGVSKVGSYTGNGSTQNIDCGFSSGARFVLLKKTSVTSHWALFDSERGIVSGNDPFLELNRTTAEKTTFDIIDPYSNGFTLTNDTTYNFNASGTTVIFYAIAAP